MIRYTKGHGTENDFVIVPDPDGTLRVDPQWVAAVCDRVVLVGAGQALSIKPSGT